MRETQAAADILSDAPTYLDVSVEPDPPVGARWGRKRGRLPHIMEKNAPGQCRRAPGGQPLEHEAGVNPDVTLGVELSRLLDSFHARNFRKHVGQQTPGIQQFQPAPTRALCLPLTQLIAL